MTLPPPSTPITCSACGTLGYAHDALTLELLLHGHDRAHAIMLPTWASPPPRKKV
jgi:hypothetical protein